MIDAVPRTAALWRERPAAGDRPPSWPWPPWPSCWRPAPDGIRIRRSSRRPSAAIAALPGVEQVEPLGGKLHPPRYETLE